MSERDLGSVSTRTTAPPHPDEMEQEKGPVRNGAEADYFLTHFPSRTGSDLLSGHASMVSRATGSLPARTTHSILQLQRQHGNRYVQRALQRLQVDAERQSVPPEVENAIEQRRGGGERLERSVQGRMEGAFGADFSGVRVHTGSDADSLSRSLNARAFTVDGGVFFRQGEYDPGSSAGQELIAHELTHVVQQSAGRVSRAMSVSEPGDAMEQEAEETASAVMRTLNAGAVTQSMEQGAWQVPNAGEAKAYRIAETGTGKPGISTRLAGLRIARKKEDATDFKGWAGEADKRAADAGTATGGFAPIKIDTAYATEQAERKEKQMDSFAKENIPFVDNNTEHYAYKKMNELRGDYVDDIARITLAQGAFNDFVTPGSVANKSAAKFKAIQSQLGFSEAESPDSDLSKDQKTSLGKNLDEKKMRELNEAVTNAEKETIGKRTEILGSCHTLQAAYQKRAANLAAGGKEKAEKEKTELDEKVKAISEGAETVSKVIEALSFGGFGAPEAIGEIAEGGTGAIKGGLELGSKGTSLIGSVAGFVAEQVYKDQIDKAKKEIAVAKVAESHAHQLDAELSTTGSMLQIEGQFEGLEGIIGRLSRALEDRKDYFASLAGKTDSRAGGEVSQYLAYVSQASETTSQIDIAKDAAVKGSGVMDTQIREMEKHRNYSYVANSAGVWDDRAKITDGEGPDLAALRAAKTGLESFIKSADAMLASAAQVVNSLPKAT